MLKDQTITKKDQWALKIANNLGNYQPSELWQGRSNSKGFCTLVTKMHPENKVSGTRYRFFHLKSTDLHTPSFQDKAPRQCFCGGLSVLI